jgi:hypothetical protein
MNPRWSLFLRAVGIKPGFRRTGPSSLVNIAVISFIGVLSGRYIFQEPLEEYWKEQHRLQNEQQQLGEQQHPQQQNGGGGDAAASLSAPATEDSYER